MQIHSAVALLAHWMESSVMKPDHLKKINSWFLEQMAVLESEKAGNQHLEEGALADLALRRIFEEHFEEIRSDQDLVDETFALVSPQASPTELREIARQAREQGNLGIRYYLDLVADYREKALE
jgi:hypothetical protein